MFEPPEGWLIGRPSAVLNAAYESSPLAEVLPLGDGGAEAVGFFDLPRGGCRNRGTFETCREDVDVAALALESAERDEERFGA